LFSKEIHQSWGSFHAFFSRQNTGFTLFTFRSVFDISTVICRSPFFPKPIHEKGGGRMKTKEKVLNELARRQEAKFWAMMRAAEPGKRCLK
jgi:hypothetical protein